MHADIILVREETAVLIVQILRNFAGDQVFWPHAIRSKQRVRFVNKDLEALAAERNEGKDGAFP